MVLHLLLKSTQSLFSKADPALREVARRVCPPVPGRGDEDCGAATIFQ
jgi:hypothetical protein